MVPELVPGLAAGGYNLYTVKGAEGLRGALDTFSGGRVAIVVAKPPYRCPAAPYEAAMLLEHYFRKRGIRDRVKVDLYVGEPGPMGVAGQHVSAAVKDMLARKAIRYHPNHGISRVNPVAHLLHFENGHSTGYDLLAFVAPHRVPQLAVRSGLANEGDWIQVDKFSLQTRYPGVYAIGDITTISLAVGKPLPKAGVFAQGQAEVVAHNIAVEVTGQGAPTRFTGYGDCLIEMGDGIGGFARGDFYAEPAPQISLHTPGPHWHLAKLLYEKAWLRRMS
jgi:sulfide:quinone oxidoreductase